MNQEEIRDEGVMCTVNVTAASHTTGRWLVKYININCSINTFTAIVDLSRFNNSCLKSRQLRT